MVSIKDAATEFLATKRIAVTGVSSNPKGHGSNVVYQRLRQRGYEVFAVNPNSDTVEGDRTYPDLKSIPGGVEGCGDRDQTGDGGSHHAGECGTGDQEGVDASLCRHRKRIVGGHGVRPTAGNHRDRRWLPLDV